jgi:hypothetical protein
MSARAARCDASCSARTLLTVTNPLGSATRVFGLEGKKTSAVIVGQGAGVGSSGFTTVSTGEPSKPALRTKAYSIPCTGLVGRVCLPTLIHRFRALLEINRLVRGPADIFAVLNDSRVM